MTTPRKPKTTPKTAQLARATGTVPPPAALARDGGKPAGGKHVPSTVPGSGASDHSVAIGSNIRPATSVKPSASSEVLDAAPYLGIADGMTNGTPGY